VKPTEHLEKKEGISERKIYELSMLKLIIEKPEIYKSPGTDKFPVPI
jgi:hypothetical protein